MSAINVTAAGSGDEDALRWLLYADQDLRIAEALLSAHPARAVCFNAHQAAEKALKSALISASAISNGRAGSRL